jgi:hypothetical protein
MNETARAQRARRKIANPIRHKAYTIAGGVKLGKGATDLIDSMLRDALGKPCEYCNNEVTLENCSLDHKEPLTRATVTPEEMVRLNRRCNLHIICLTCNRTKGALTHEQFWRLLELLNTDEAMRAIVLTRLKAANFMWGGRR